MTHNDGCTCRTCRAWDAQTSPAASDYERGCDDSPPSDFDLDDNIRQDPADRQTPADTNAYRASPTTGRSSATRRTRAAIPRSGTP